MSPRQDDRKREGEQIVYGRRIDGVRLSDRPAGGGRRAYLVERGLEKQARSKRCSATI